MPNVVARLVVLIFGLTLSFFLVHAGAAGISIPVHFTDAENYCPSPSPGRTPRPWWCAPSRTPWMRVATPPEI